MKAIEFEGQTGRLGLRAEWGFRAAPKLDALPVRALLLADGRRHLVSYWKPSQEEMTALADGAYVRLEVVGPTHPPVSVSVEPAVELP